MFVCDIKALLSEGKQDGSRLPRQYAECFRKCSAAVSGLAAKQSSGMEIQEEAWMLFREYIMSAIALAIGNGKRDLHELESAQPLLNGFLSVLFPGKNYADEINSRLDYIAKRAFDAAWSENEDAYSPLDTPDSFRQMLNDHLEQTAGITRTIAGNGREDDAVVPLQTQLLEIEFEQARYKRDQKEYAHFERLHRSALNLLKRAAGNAACGGQWDFKDASAWDIRAALKERVRLTEGKTSAGCAGLTWETVCSVKAAVRKSPREPDKPPCPRHNLR